MSFASDNNVVIMKIMMLAVIALQVPLLAMCFFELTEMWMLFRFTTIAVIGNTTFSGSFFINFTLPVLIVMFCIGVFWSVMDYFFVYLNIRDGNLRRGASSAWMNHSRQ
ncbi:MAG: hypothetical protein QXU18_12380 [Thermoplasmatales archaeon]